MTNDGLFNVQEFAEVLPYDQEEMWWSPEEQILFQELMHKVNANDYILFIFFSS